MRVPNEREKSRRLDRDTADATLGIIHIYCVYMYIFDYIFNVLWELIEILPEGCVLKAKMLHCCPVELLKNKGHINLRMHCSAVSLLVLDLAFKLPRLASTSENTQCKFAVLED